MELPVELKSPEKGLTKTKIKNVLWCRVRHINPSKEHPERIKKTDKKLLKKLIMMELSLLYNKKILTRLN